VLGERIVNHTDQALESVGLVRERTEPLIAIPTAEQEMAALKMEVRSLLQAKVRSTTGNAALDVIEQVTGRRTMVVNLTRAQLQTLKAHLKT